MITYSTDKLQKVLLGGECKQNGTPTPDTPIDIICNNGVIKVHNKSGLPLRYQMVEYLQSSGEEYINLGYTLNTAKDDVELDIQLLSDTSATNFFGARNSTTIKAYTLATQANGGVYRWRWGWINSSDIVQTTVVDTNRHMLRVDHTTQTLSVDGVVIDTRTIASNITTSINATLFAIHATMGDDYYFGSLKIFGYKKWTNGVLVQNLIPCRRNSDNVLGMYDLVSQTFLTNKGTGTFTAGADVDDLEIYTDGTQEVVMDSVDNTATAEMLLKVGDYKDMQEVLTGSVTRNIGIKVLDGTEDWVVTSVSGLWLLYNVPTTSLPNTCICTHFLGVSTTTSGLNMPDLSIRYGVTDYSNRLYIKYNSLANVDELKQYLAIQYANGTPVIVVYPLATSITESVTGLTLTTSPVILTKGSIFGMPILTSNITKKLNKRYISDSEGIAKEVKKIYVGNNLIYKSSLVPSGYTLLQYISSTLSGGLYINLGCKLMETTDDIGIDIKFNIKGGGSDGTNLLSTLIAGLPEISPWPGFTLRRYSTFEPRLELVAKWLFTNSTKQGNNAKYNSKYLSYVYNNSWVDANWLNIYEFSEVLDNIPSTQLNDFVCHLFCALNGSNQPFRFVEADLYYLKLTKGNTVVRDLIPAKRNSDNEVGLYDIQNNVFYPSQGANSFVGGPSV